MRATALKLALLLIAVPGLRAEDEPKKVADPDKVVDKGIPAKPDALFSTQAFPCCVLSYKLAATVKDSENKAIAEFATKVDKSHSELADRISGALKESKLAVVAGTEKGFQEKIDSLADKKGSEADRAFLQMLIEGHEKSIPLFEAEAERGSLPAMKKVAADAVPILKGHLEEAKKLLKTVK